MSFSTGLRATRIQTKRKKRQKTALFLMSLCALGFFAWLFFQFGKYHVESKQNAIEQAHEKALLSLQEMSSKMEALEQAIVSAKEETKTWSERYQRDVPEGVGKDLYEMIQKKMEEGISVDRLSFVLRNTQQSSKCSEKPIIKKILLKSNGKQGAPEKVSFFEDKVSFQGEGKPTKNPNGTYEFWFDPQAPISIVLNHVSGKKHETNGVLPFQSNFIVGDQNYVFNIRSGPRGYVYVSGIECSYP